MIQKFHAHAYFQLSQIGIAEDLYGALPEAFPVELNVGSFHLNAVGPHPLPMFTLMFNLNTKDELIRFLQINRNGLTVLIHEDTGDDYRDHTVGAQWLGTPLIINFEHFERIKYEKSALVFPESISIPQTHAE